MKENDRLQEVLEQAEDAYFEVVMGEYAEQLGAEYLAEAKRLNADPTFDYPEELDQKCQTLIKRAGKRKKRQAFGRGLKKVANVAAVIVAIIALTGTMLFVTVEAFRAETLNFLIKNFPQAEGTTARVGETSKDGMDFVWAPEDCVLVGVEHGNSMDRYKYIDLEGRPFVLHLFNAHGSVSIDTELAQSDYIEFGSQKAYYSEKDGTQTLTWIDSDTNTVYTLSSIELTINDLLTLAESIYN